MGSRLGPTFANFYMGELETNVFSDDTIKPEIYARYVDDIFCSCTFEHVQKVKVTFEEQSVLKFTYEKAKDDKLPFWIFWLILVDKNTVHLYM